MIKADKILIRLPNWVGDVVMATAAFRCIRDNFPSAKISVICKPYVKLILKDSPWFDEFIEYEDNLDVTIKGYGSYKNLTKRLRKEEYDLGFIFPNSFSSALMFWFAGVKRRIGYARDARGILLTDGLKRPMENGKFKPGYMADYYLELCYIAGCKKESSRPELFFSKECKSKLEQVLSKCGIPDKKQTILVNPGAAYGSSKCWTISGFAEVVDLLNRRFDCNILLISGPGETELSNDIKMACATNVYNLTNNDIPLDLLKPLIKKSSLLLTVDSGPRHFAVALGTPTVVLTGPTDLRYTETAWESGRVICNDVECGPCHKKTCPTDHKCMEGISSQRVVEACEDILKTIS
ncbi:MAG: lipopolysaccharide heptosyltransferase II [Candidatus Anammoxibacter sp.]